MCQKLGILFFPRFPGGTRSGIWSIKWWKMCQKSGILLFFPRFPRSASCASSLPGSFPTMLPSCTRSWWVFRMDPGNSSSHQEFQRGNSLGITGSASSTARGAHSQLKNLRKKNSRMQHFPVPQVAPANPAFLERKSHFPVEKIPGISVFSWIWECFWLYSQKYPFFSRASTASLSIAWTMQKHNSLQHWGWDFIPKFSSGNMGMGLGDANVTLEGKPSLVPLFCNDFPWICGDL